MKSKDNVGRMTEPGMHYTACCAPVLHLTLKKYWFEQVEIKGIRIGKPKVEWCIDAIEFDQNNGSYDDCFIIKLGSVLS